MKKFIAKLVDIKDMKSMPAEFLPIVDLKAELEKREIVGNERIAILNIENTSSYFPVFLDSWKGIKDVEREVDIQAYAVLNSGTRIALEKALRKTD